jgi:hypothetical protein
MSEGARKYNVSKNGNEPKRTGLERPSSNKILFTIIRRYGQLIVKIWLHLIAKRRLFFYKNTLRLYKIHSQSAVKQYLYTRHQNGLY